MAVGATAILAILACAVPCRAAEPEESAATAWALVTTARGFGRFAEPKREPGSVVIDVEKAVWKESNETAGERRKPLDKWNGVALPEGAVEPRFSRDGARAAYLTAVPGEVRRGKVPARQALRAIEIKGANVSALLARATIREYAWSPDGKFLACSHDDGLTVFRAADGGKEATIDNRTLDDELFAHAVHHLCWRPDSGALAFRVLFQGGRHAGGGKVEHVAGDRDIFVLELKARRTRQIELPGDFVAEPFSSLVPVRWIAKRDPNDGGAKNKDRIPDESRKRVDALLEKMELGLYHGEISMPILSWEDVPALLEHIRSARKLENFPVNPLSSQSQDECRAGVMAMWLIDGIRHEGRFPSLNPILSSKDSQPDIAERAAAAYERWWKRVATWPKEEARRLRPLAGSGIGWYGERPWPPEPSTQTLPLRPAGGDKPIVSASDDGRFYCVMTPDQNRDGVLEVFAVGAERDNLLWRTDGWFSPLVFCLRGGIVVRMPPALFRHLREALPNEPAEVCFFRDGRLLGAHTVKEMIISPEHVVPGSVSLLYERDTHVWLIVETQPHVNVQPHHIEFDLTTGQLTRSIDVTPER